MKRVFVINGSTMTAHELIHEIKVRVVDKMDPETFDWLYSHVIGKSTVGKPKNVVAARITEGLLKTIAFD